MTDGVTREAVIPTPPVTPSIYAKSFGDHYQLLTGP
jgi:hypothetical protein